jgi:subtilisin family serine protease
VVAVIDTGIDYTHPDLAANIWSAPAPFAVTIGGVSITCPAGSHGFNAIALTCDPMDDHNHGTHVSGTIGAAAGNGAGVVGVNWVTQLMGVKFLNASGSGTIADAINALDFVMQARQAFAATGGADVRVLSNSWGGRSFSQALRDEIAATADADMLFVAAAGNDGFSNDILPTYPAGYDVDSIVAVAATSNTDGRAYFSNYGAASVDLGAPGVDILSTTIGNTYSFSSGTSMATPHVSGAAALVLSRCDLATAELRSTLLSTVQPVAALASMTATGGRLDVNSAIRSCMAPPAAPSGLTATGRDASGRVELVGRRRRQPGSSSSGPRLQAVRTRPSPPAPRARPLSTPAW